MKRIEYFMLLATAISAIVANVGLVLTQHRIRALETLAIADRANLHRVIDILDKMTATSAIVQTSTIDVTRSLNTKSISADFTFRFSDKPRDNSHFVLVLENDDKQNAHTVTFPSAALYKDDRTWTDLEMITQTSIPPHSSRSIFFLANPEKKPGLFVWLSQPRDRDDSAP